MLCRTFCIIVARLLIYSLLHQNNNRKKPRKTVKTVESKIKKRKTSATKWMNMHNMQHLQCKIKPPLQQYKLNARVVLNVLKRGKSVILFACYGFISNIT